MAQWAIALAEKYPGWPRLDPGATVERKDQFPDIL